MPLQKYNNWIKALWQTAVIILMAGLAGVFINHFRPDSLALVADWSTEARLTTASGKRLDISLADAKKLFTEKAAVFMDARSSDDYESEHIQGAHSLPWHDVDRRFIAVAENISPDTPIITYCDGETCSLSHDLALFLLNMGFNNVRVLVNGWTVWLKDRLPVEKGTIALDEG
jgi:rhodanese-related sulfurtransferase